MRAFRWRYLLEHDKKKVSLYNRFAANVVGFTVTFIFPGRLGELVKPLYLAKKENMGRGFVIGTVVVERIFDIFTMCFLLGVFLVAKPLYSSIFHIDAESYSRLYLWGIIALSVSLVLMLISLSLYFFRDKTVSVFSFFLKPFPKKFADKIIMLLDEFIRGLKFFHSIKNLLLFFVWSVLVWLSIIFIYWVLFQAYNIQVAYFFLFPYVFLVIIGASIPTPGMVGGFHAFSRIGLVSLFGLDANLAVGMTIVAHAVQLAVTCLMGYVILWKEGISIFQIRKLGENNKK
jgi:uncharacterized protein (TIRG00374 family)